jgi:protein gp37
VFYEEVSTDVIAYVFAVMACCPQHTFLLLTKRHGRMKAVLNDPGFRALYQAAYTKLAARLRKENPRRWGNLPETAPWPLLNLHLGVSAENQKWFNIRVPALLDCRDAAGVLWVSAEPLLGPIDLINAGTWAVPDPPDDHDDYTTCQRHGAHDCQHAQPHAGCAHLDWIVTGGENGQRPCEPEWLLSLRDQCASSGVPFWMKQTGTVLARRLGLPGKGEDWDDLPPDYQVRQLPQPPVKAAA